MTDSLSHATEDAMRGMIVLLRSGGLAALLVAGLTVSAPASAMTAKTRAYLVLLGIDPSGADVKIADADGEIRTTFRGDPDVFSLEGLAAAKKANAVRSFIATRAIIRKLKADEARFTWPAAGYPDYDGRFLTPAERLLVLPKILSK